MPVLVLALALLLRSEPGFESEDLLAGRVVFGDGCTTVRMRVAAAEVVEEVVTEDMDVKTVGEDEDEDEEVEIRVLEELKATIEAINCSGDAASKVSLVGYEQFSLPDP